MSIGVHGLMVQFSYMLPATPHAVLTLEPCLALGGHFYTGLHFKRTLYGLVYEHLCGDFATNTANTRSPSLLFRTFMSLTEQIMRGRACNNSKNIFLLIFIYLVLTMGQSVSQTARILLG